MASLTELPLELLVMVSSHLSTPDLGSLRRTCKTIEKALFDDFVNEFFVKKQFMLTAPSLQAMIDISRHAELSKHVKHVIVGLDHYKTQVIPHLAYDEQRDRYQQGLEEQRTLLTTGIDTEMLSEAFRNFTNLNTVEMRDYESFSYRVRDKTPWRSYGSTTIFNETGQWLPAGSRHGWVEDDLLSATTAFKKMIYALGKSGCTPPAFQVILRGRSKGLQDSAFRFPQYALPAVEPVVRGIKTLLLEIGDSSSDTRSLQHFLHHTLDLEHLRLNFWNGGEQYNASILEWLAQSPADATANLGNGFRPSLTSSSVAPPPTSLPRLTRLDIGSAKITPEALNSLLLVMTKFSPSLKEFSLWRATVQGKSSSWTSTSKPNFWADFFYSLSRISSLELNYLLVSSLAQDEDETTYPFHVGFKTLGSSPQIKDSRSKPAAKSVKTYLNLDSKVEHSTKKGMKELIAELAERVCVNRPIVESESEKEIAEYSTEEDEGDGGIEDEYAGMFDA